MNNPVNSKALRILALCGSVRPGSTNHALLIAARKFLPASTHWCEFPIRDLPFFDPQAQFGEMVPRIVRELRREASAADAILIATPEYAHGIPGILKNALEWLICEESLNKSVSIFISSPSGGEFVRSALVETLRAMSLLIKEERILVIPAARKQIDSNGEIQDPEFGDLFKSFVQKIVLRGQ